MAATTSDPVPEFTEGHGRAVALHAALNQLFTPQWQMDVGSKFYVFSLTIQAEDANPFVFYRSIQAGHISATPTRTAEMFADEVCERWGRWSLMKPEQAPF